MLTVFLRLNVTLSCFKQPPLNASLVLVPLYSKFGVMLWLYVLIELIISQTIL